MRKKRKNLSLSLLEKGVSETNATHKDLLKLSFVWVSTGPQMTPFVPSRTTTSPETALLPHSVTEIVTQSVTRSFLLSLSSSQARKWLVPSVSRHLLMNVYKPRLMFRHLGSHLGILARSYLYCCKDKSNLKASCLVSSGWIRFFDLFKGTSKLELQGQREQRGRDQRKWHFWGRCVPEFFSCKCRCFSFPCRKTMEREVDAS